MGSVKKRAVPAVAAALLAAGGVVWIEQNTTATNTRTHDDDRIVRLELHTTGHAVAVALARSGWRGTLIERSESVSGFRSYDVWVMTGEPVEFIIIGEQEAASGRRQTVRCRIEDDGREVVNKPLTVRGGDKRSVECRYGT